MKKMIALTLSAIMALSLVACGDKGTPAADIEIPDPFSECSSLEEAAQNAGFSFNVPETVDGYAQRIIRTMADGEGSAMIEVIYKNEIDEKENTDRADEIRMRKANGKELPLHYRETFHLFYHEGYSTAEIALILKMKESTVRSNLRRGRIHLKEILKEAYGIDEAI